MTQDNKEAKLTPTEALELAWRLLGERPRLGTTVAEILQRLRYEVEAADDNPVNAMRDQLIHHIESNQGRLSMWCHGRCYEHPDIVVIACHLHYLEDTTKEDPDAETGTEHVQLDSHPASAAGGGEGDGP